MAEVIRKVPEKVRGMFDGLDLGHAPGKERSWTTQDGARRSTAAPEQARSAEADRDRLRSQAIQRHARAVEAVWNESDQGLPVQPHQRQELDRSREGLRQIGPHAAKDLERAYLNDSSLAPEAASGRTQRALRAMQLEAEIRTNPVLRADRFVQDWTRLDDAHRAAYVRGDYTTVWSTRDQMGAMVESLERDAQVESILRGRRVELGVRLELGRGIAYDLATSVGVSIGRGLGIGM